MIRPSPLSSCPTMTTWNSFTQTHRVFNWRDILHTWSVTFVQGHYVKTVLSNLRLTTDPSDSVRFPLSHFLTYLNHEKEGLAWFIYEVAASRPSYFGVSMNFLQELVTLVDLDSGFPEFFGSPNLTIRQYLENELNNEELDYVGMMPPLVPLVATTTRARVATRAVSNTIANATSVYPPIMLRLIRKDGNSGTDDIIKISYTSESVYTISYNDQHSKVKNKTQMYSPEAVIEYLSKTFRLAKMDEDPFVKLQLLLPNMPTVLLVPKNLDSESRDLIYDSVNSVLTNWPVTSS